jgi:hypothetical protein
MIPGSAAELAALFPAPRSVVIAGRTIEIKRCGIAQGGRIIDAGAGLYARIQGGAEFLDLFEQFPSETSALIVAATGLPLEWVTGLDPVDQFALASEWMDVNAGFFAIVGAGPTLSTASPSTDTPTPESTPRKRRGNILNPSQPPKGANAAPAP